MELGALVPFGDIGGDPDTVRDYAQGLEAAGFDFLEAPDHVLGVNVASRPDWDMSRNTSHDAGINPRPASGRVPLWYGGHHENTLLRIAKWGDGWMPNAYPPDQSAVEVFNRLRALIEAEGRDPAAVGIEVWTSCGAGSVSDWRKEIEFWKAQGVSHICLTTTFGRRHHHRIAGTSLSDHLAAATRYRDAVAECL